MTVTLPPRPTDAADPGQSPLRHPRSGVVGGDAVRAQHVLAVLLSGVLVTAPLFLVLAPLGSDGARGNPLLVALSWAIVVYSSIRIGVFCWRARPRWAEVFLWAFSYVWLGLASLAQTASDLNPMSTPLDDTTIAIQLSLVLVGFLAFDAGRSLSGRRRTPADADTAAPRADRPAPRWVLSRTKVLALGLATLALTPVFVAAFGGLSTLFTSRQALTDQLTESALYSGSSTAGGGTLVVVANVLPFVSALGILCLWRAYPALRRDLWLIGTFAGLVVVNLMVNNPISNARYWVFAVALAVLLCLRTMERPLARIALLTFFLVAATVLFPYADAFRTDSVGVQNTTRSTSRPVDFLIGKTDYGAVTDIGIAVRYTENHGHTNGWQLLGALTFWMPRALWPDKPVNTAEILADEANFPNRNLDTPLWAEGYIDFGFVGTIGVMALLGALVRRADDVLERASDDPVHYSSVAFPAAVSFAGYESFLLRGSLLQAMAKIVFVMATIALLGSRTTGMPSTTTPAPAGLPSTHHQGDTS